MAHGLNRKAVTNKEFSRASTECNDLRSAAVVMEKVISKSTHGLNRKAINRERMPELYSECNDLRSVVVVMEKVIRPESTYVYVKSHTCNF
jgi:hypothetical protein